MRAMLVRCLLALALATFLTSCVSLREGNVVAKKSRKGMFNVYATWDSFISREPDVYWVRLEGVDENGKAAHKDVILWRQDWEQLRVGDHWDREHGFVPGTPEGK